MSEATTRKGTRSCVGCKAQAGKASLLRIVRLADGSIAYDSTGRVPGRGAYVCSVECYENALKSKKLQRALKATIQEEDARRIADEIAAAERRAEMG